MPASRASRTAGNTSSSSGSKRQSAGAWKLTPAAGNSRCAGPSVENGRDAPWVGAQYLQMQRTAYTPIEPSWFMQTYLGAAVLLLGIVPTVAALLGSTPSSIGNVPQVGDVAITHCNGDPDRFGFPLRIWAYDMPDSIGWYSKEAVVEDWQIIKAPLDSGLNLWEIAALPLRAPTAYHLWRRALGIYRQHVRSSALPPDHISWAMRSVSSSHSNRSRTMSPYGPSATWPPTSATCRPPPTRRSRRWCRRSTRSAP